MPTDDEIFAQQRQMAVTRLQRPRAFSHTTYVDGAYGSFDPGEEGGGGSSAPDWLPEGDVAYFDPVENHYYANGREQTLAETVDITSYRSASGYTVLAADNQPVFLGDFLDALLTADWTVIADITIPATSIASCNVFILRDDEDNTELGFGPQIAGGASLNGVGAFDYEGEVTDPDPPSTALFSLPVDVRIAFTRTQDDRQELSWNGRPAVFYTGGTTDDAFTMAVIKGWNAGGTGGGDMVIRKLRVRASVAIEDLPGLSTP